MQPNNNSFEPNDFKINNFMSCIAIAEVTFRILFMKIKNFECG